MSIQIKLTVVPGAITGIGGAVWPVFSHTDCTFGFDDSVILVSNETNTTWMFWLICRRNLPQGARTWPLPACHSVPSPPPSSLSSSPPTPAASPPVDEEGPGGVAILSSNARRRGASGMEDLRPCSRPAPTIFQHLPWQTVNEISTT